MTVPSASMKLPLLYMFNSNDSALKIELHQRWAGEFFTDARLCTVMQIYSACFSGVVTISGICRRVGVKKTIIIFGVHILRVLYFVNVL